MSSRGSRRWQPFLSILGLALLSGTAGAQTLGSAFTYQGQLTDANAPANGLFDLQLCLYDVASGASPLLCAADFDDVPVESGVFTLAVDFGSAPFVGQQRFLELRVRPGASTGAYTTLAPRQLLRAAPEALRANVASAAPWSGLTGVPAGFADGIDNVGSGVSSVGTGAGLTGGPITTVGTLSIAPAGVVGSMIAPGTVGSVHLAANAIDSTRIVDETIVAADIGTNEVGASELANNAVDTAAILDAQVTSAKIAPGAVGTAQIDATQVQRRVSGTCGVGEYFRGINADGSLDCNLLPSAFDRVLDLEGDVGSHVAVALRTDQRPLVAYHDQGAGNLKFYDCADATCASGTRRVLDSTGDVGENIAVAVGPGGLPVIAYRSVTALSLKLYACANAACTSGTARTLDSSVDVGGAIAMALRADGRPFISYRDQTNFQLRVYDCDDTACTSGTARTPTGSSLPYGTTSVALRADGRALIALGGNAGAGTPVRVFECGDAGCTTGTQRALTNTSFNSFVSMIIRNTNRPLVAVAGLGSPLRVFDCSDTVCIGSSDVSYGTNTVGAVAISLRADDRALIVYGVPSPGGLDLVDCSAPTCATGSSRNLATPGNFGVYAALAVRTDGRPVIAFYDGDNDDLRLRICANPDCL